MWIPDETRELYIRMTKTTINLAELPTYNGLLIIDGNMHEIFTFNGVEFPVIDMEIGKVIKEGKLLNVERYIS